MARPHKFTDEDILAAAEQLVAAGKAVTGFTLYGLLGGGRPSSLEERYKLLGAPAKPAPALPALPTEVAHAVEELTVDVASRLTAVLTSTHASLKALANARIDELEQAAEQQYRSVKVELDDAAEKIGIEQERAEKAEAELAAATESLQALKVQLSKLEGAAAESARQLDSLKADLVTQAEQLQKALNDNASMASQLVRAEESRNIALIQAEEANKRRESAEKREAGAEAKLEQTAASLRALQVEQAHRQKDIGSLEAQLAAMVNEKQTLIERAKKQKEGHQQEMAKAQEALSAQAQELAKAQAELKLLKEQPKK